MCTGMDEHTRGIKKEKGLSMRTPKSKALKVPALNKAKEVFFLKNKCKKEKSDVFWKSTIYEAPGI